MTRGTGDRGTPIPRTAVAGPPTVRRGQSVGQLWFRTRLFLSAYALLFALLAIKFEQLYLWVTCASLAVLGIEEGLRFVYWTSRQGASYSYRILKVSDAGAVVNGFLASHLLPFLAPGNPRVREQEFTYVLFLLVLLVVSVNSDLAYVNPILYLTGRRVVTVEHDGGTSTLICRATPRPGDIVYATPLVGALIETS